jgi:hypothetical protein
MFGLALSGNDVMEAVISVIIIEICELFSIKEWIMSTNRDIGVNIIKNRRSAPKYKAEIIMQYRC